MTPELTEISNKLSEFAKKDLAKLSAEEIDAARACILEYFSIAATDRELPEVKDILLHSSFTNFKMNILHVLAKFGAEQDLQDVLHFIEEQSCIEIKDVNSFTPLHYAARDGWLETVKILLASGADKNPKASAQYRQWTPIHFAAKNGHIEVVKTLLDAGVEKETVTGFGLTPLHVAAEFGHADLVQYLLSLGLNKNAKSIHENHEMTPLHYAVMGNFHDIVVMLVKAGADRDAKMSNGMTTLQIAAQNGKVETVSFLLKYGENFVEDALQVAQERKNLEVVREIEKFQNAKKNLFKNIYDLADGLATQIKNFNADNLSEEKITLPDAVVVNAYGILSLKCVTGILRKEKKSLLQVAQEEKLLNLANGLKGLAQLVGTVRN